ncbi:MAG: DUF2513 domain-containing protein [Dehalococcoidales bacterium]|jgi:hypothetical protein
MHKLGISMKRDMDLIRQMLLAIEAEPSGWAPDKLEIPNYTQEQINYHAVLLGEAGLAIVGDISTGENPAAMVSRLTWAGHEFLDASRENQIWNQAKDAIAKIGGASIPIWTALLTEIIKKKLNL